MTTYNCQYCGRECANKSGQTLHEKKCKSRSQHECIPKEPSMRTMAFIDAGQFRPAILINKLGLPSEKRFDWDLFRQLLVDMAGGQLFDTHYFDSPEIGTNRQAPFHRLLKNTLNFNLHFSEMKERRVVCSKCNQTHIDNEQKGVDVSLTVVMMALAYRNAYDQALLCSGDGDFAPLVEHLRHALGKRIVVIGWKSNIATTLKDAAYKVIHIDDHRDELISNKIRKMAEAC